MTPELTATLVALLAIVIAAVALYQARQPLTLTGVTTALANAQPIASELTEAALTGAQAAEQLFRSGKITKSARLDKAFDYVRRFYPDLDQAMIITAIESAVLVVNTIADALPDKAAPAAAPKSRVDLTGLL